jgi:D-threonate/D-erythronate kinase
MFSPRFEAIIGYPVETSHLPWLCYPAVDTPQRFSRLAIIADDLTGAADSGAPFARLGFSTVVLLDTADMAETSVAADGPSGEPEVLVVNTDSRYREPAEAAKSVTVAARGILSLGFPLIYKKIDSLFRGNVGTEIAAAMDAIRARQCLLAPAFPEQGRTTEGGRCLVRGSPLPSADIAGILDSNAPGAFDVSSLALADYAGTDPAGLQEPPETSGPPQWPPHRPPRGDRRLLLADAWKQEHLDGLATGLLDYPAAGTPLLLAGSGGFAAAIARVMARTAGRKPGTPAPFRSSGVLVVSGSRSDEAARQLEELRSATGAPVVTPVDPPEDAVAGVRKALAALAGGRLAVVATDPGPTIAGASGRVAAMATEILASGLRPRLLFVGGETAMATLRLAGATRMFLFGELEPGVAYGRVPESRFGALEIATKAGAFGDPATLLRLTERLSLF